MQSRNSRISEAIPRLIWAVALSAISVVSSGLAQESRTSLSYTLDPANIVNRIDEKVYGHFFEHIYHSANGGLWGERVWNRSFEENSAGRWSIEDNQLVQSGTGSDLRLVFGDRSWTDYEFSFDAFKTGGSEGFLVMFRVMNDRDFYWYNIGGWGNVRSQLEKSIDGSRGGAGPSFGEGIETGKWYSIRVRCQGNHIRIWMDGRQALDYTDRRSPHLSGAVGLATWSTQAKFRNIKVVSLSGQTLFQGLPEVTAEDFGVRHWSMFGPGNATTTTEDPFNSNFSVQIDATAGQTGIEQDEFAVKAGEVYAGSLWARGTASNGLRIRLVAGETLTSQTLGQVGDDWKELAFELRPTVSDANATVQVVVPEGGKVQIDQVSMMPRSWAAAGGFRPDLLDAVAAIKPPIIRWPGGCFASPYRWKDGIGPQSQRKVTPRELWDDLDINSLGTDEFIALCRKVGAEPLIVVNIGTPQWNDNPGAPEFLQDALDWIEYCNGPATSEWGAKRAANGHPEPYDVKYWEIDNETWSMGADAYIAAVKQFAPAMRQADPSIKLAVCGSNRFDLEWNRRMIEGCGDLFDYLSIHGYEDAQRYADGPYTYERFIRQTGDLIAQSSNPDMKIYCSEWNAQSTDWRTGLYAGGILNSFERLGDIFEIGGPALFLRHISATAWDNAFINFDQYSWFPAPNYVVMKLWRDHYAPNRIAISPDSDVLNTVATKSEDGRTLYVKTVNPGESTVDVSLTLPATIVPITTTMKLVAPGSLDARNTLDRPEAVRVEDGEVRIDGHEMSLTLPPMSAAIVTITL